VLFDFGNTLFAHASLARTIELGARRCGAAVSFATALELARRIDRAAHAPEELALGRDLDAAVWSSSWQRLYAVADEVAAGVGDEVYRLMHDPAEWMPFEATKDTLRRLRGHGVRVGVLSNTGWDIRVVFDHLGLAGFIDTFVLSCEIGAVKPKAEAFVLACEQLGVEPSGVLMVGDDVVADIGACGVGLRTLLLPPAAAGSDNGIGLVAKLLT